MSPRSNPVIAGFAASAAVVPEISQLAPASKLIVLKALNWLPSPVSVPAVEPARYSLLVLLLSTTLPVKTAPGSTISEKEVP